MTIARAFRPPNQDQVGDWEAAGGLLSTLLGSGSGSRKQERVWRNV